MVRWQHLVPLLATLLLAQLSCAEELEGCDWCTGGVCGPTCPHVKSQLQVPGLTQKTNRTFPYWYSPQQAPLGEFSKDVVVRVHISTEY